MPNPNSLNSSSAVPPWMMREQKKEKLKQLWLDFTQLHEQNQANKSWLYQTACHIWPHEPHPLHTMDKILKALATTNQQFESVKNLYYYTYINERFSSAHTTLLKTLWWENSRKSLWQLSKGNKNALESLQFSVESLLENTQHTLIPEPWQILYVVQALSKKPCPSFKISIFLNNCVLVATEDGWKYNAEETSVPVEQTPILINYKTQLSISMPAPSVWINRKLQIYLKLRTGHWKVFHTHPGNFTPQILSTSTLPKTQNALNIYQVKLSKRLLREAVFCLLCALDTYFTSNSDYQPIVPPLISNCGALTFVKFLERILVPSKKPCHPFYALCSSLISPSISLSVILAQFLLANLQISECDAQKTVTTAPQVKSSLTSFGWNKKEKKMVFKTPESTVYEGILPASTVHPIVIVITNQEHAKILAELLESLPIFTYVGGYEIYSSASECKSPFILSTLENLQFLFEKRIKPAALFFWGLSSLLGTMPSAKDTVKMKTYAFLWLQSSPYSEIPRILVPETRYVQFHMTRTLTLRKSLKSSNVTRALLQFLAAYEPQKQQKVRQSVACRGASFPSKAFILHPAEKGVPPNQKVQFCELRFMLNPVFLEVKTNALQKISDTNCVEAGINLISFKEMNFVACTKFKSIQQSLKCIRDMRALINCCFGNAFATLFHKNTRVSQVAQKIALQCSEDQKAPLPVAKTQITQEFIRNILAKNKWMLNSNLRVSIGIVLFVAMQYGTVVFMTLEKDAVHTLLPLVSLLLEVLDKNFTKNQLVTYFHPLDLQNSIYAQEQKWNHLQPVSTSHTKRLNMFGHYLETIKLSKQEIHLANFSFELWCSQELKKPDNNANIILNESEEKTFSKQSVQDLLKKLGNWKPTPDELYQLQQVFASLPGVFLPPSMLNLCLVLVVKLELTDFVHLINLTWLLNIQPLFQVLLLAFPLTHYTDTPNNTNCPFFKTTLNSAEKEIRLQIDDYTSSNLRKICRYQYLGQELADAGILRAEDYEPDGKNRQVFWKKQGFTFGQKKNLTVTFRVQPHQKEALPYTYTYTKKNTLPLIDLMLHTKGWGSNSSKTKAVWVCNPHLLPIGTRLRSPAVCSIKVLGNFFREDVPLMRLDGLVYAIVPDLFIKTPLPMHENHEWLVEQAEKHCVSEEEFAQHTLHKPLPDIEWGQHYPPTAEIQSFVEFASTGIQQELGSSCTYTAVVHSPKRSEPPTKKRKVISSSKDNNDDNNCSALAKWGLGLV